MLLMVICVVKGAAPPFPHLHRGYGVAAEWPFLLLSESTQCVSAS